MKCGGKGRAHGDMEREASGPQLRPAGRPALQGQRGRRGWPAGRPALQGKFVGIKGIE